MLENNSKRLDFITNVDWHETKTMLRAEFPLDIRSTEAAFDIPFGFYKRPLHNNQPQDTARFEVSMQRYVDISESNYGVALLNDCKYGCLARNGLISLALLKSSKSPDPKADMGQHDFTYSLLPHSETLSNSNILLEAARLNRPPLLLNNYHNETIAPIISLNSESVIIEAIKKAEKANTIAIRLVESKGRHSQVELSVPEIYRQVQEADILERPFHTVLLSRSGVIHLSLKPFEIKTLLLIKS